MTRLHKRLIITILALIALVGCSEKKQSSNNYADADGYNTADSIISAISDERDWDKFLAACDSFEHAGDISKAKSIFYRLWPTICWDIIANRSVCTTNWPKST